MYIALMVYVVCVGALYRIAFGPYKLLGLFHLFYLSYVVSIVIALPALNNGSRYYEVYLLSALTTPLLFLLGGVIGKVRLFPAFNSGSHYLEFDDCLKRNSLGVFVAFLGLFWVYVLDVGVNSSGLLYALSNPGDSIEAMELRMRALTSNVSPFLTRLYGYLRAFIVPFICCLFLVYWLSGEMKFRRFFFLVVVSIFYCAFSAAKAPVFYLFLTLALTYYWWHFHTNPRLAYKYLFRFSFVIFVGLIVSSLFYPLLHGVSGWEAIDYAWEQLNHRVFEVPSSVAMRYFEYFGSTIEFLGWKGNSVAALFFDVEYVSSAQLLYSYFYSNMFSDRGLMNAAFFSSMYADFGLISMFIGTILCGVVVGQVQLYLDKIPFGAISIACRAVCSLAVMQLVLTNFISILVGRGFILLPLLLCLSIYTYRFAKQSFRS